MKLVTLSQNLNNREHEFINNMVIKLHKAASIDEVFNPITDGLLTYVDLSGLELPQPKAQEFPSNRDFTIEDDALPESWERQPKQEYISSNKAESIPFIAFG
ncbi:hypothetical protein [Photobacterium satsumensis]|uniref:hypothetical protein n=1 Tax=Photobacterium satsumensis TaxID=2910239 RepID=UPI003D13B570